jgi:hypothetical protein
MDELTSRREARIADALTEKVLQAYSGIDNVRLREIVACLIRHLHAFVREARPTDKEFESGWTVMAEMAKFTGDERNEFLLLCDVIGVSQLVETINHGRPQSAVGSLLSGLSTGPMLRCVKKPSLLPATTRRRSGPYHRPGLRLDHQRAGRRCNISRLAGGNKWPVRKSGQEPTRLQSPRQISGGRGWCFPSGGTAADSLPRAPRWAGRRTN